MSESDAKAVSFTSSANSPVPPYVPYRSFRNFIDSLKQGIPARIDRSVMASMSGAIQSQLTASLRYLELITPSAQPTMMLPRLVNSEGPERVKVMRDILGRAYPFLFTQFDLKTATPRMVDEQFASVGASGGTIDKCVNFFLAAAREAGVDLSPHLKANRQRTQRRPRIVRQSGHGQAIDDGSGEVDRNDTNGDLTWAQMLLSKFPSFDPGWPDEVKAKWFDAFDKLMKQGQAE